MTKEIDIKELIPFMKKGWVAMDKDETWLYFTNKPIKYDQYWKPRKNWFIHLNVLFKIKPVVDWTKSLIKVENKDE